MTREEEIQKAATESCSKYNMPYGVHSFIEGARWSDEHPAKKQTVTIDAWVARDMDGSLGIFYDGKEPEMRGCCDYHFAPGKVLHVPRHIFPDLTWESDPEEVEIILKRKKK